MISSGHSPKFAEIYFCMRLSFFAFAFLLIGTIGCQQPTKTAETKQVPVPAAAPSSRLGKEGTDQLTTLLAAYYDLKDALVATNAGKADIAASRILSAGETFNNNLPKDSTNQVLLQHIDTIMKQSEAILGIKDESCMLKRVFFEKISTAMYAAVKDAQLQHAGIYHQYCPMAFNEKGAYWLSNVSEIQNPYYGKKMLECGEVKDSL